MILSERKTKILEAIIRDYISTAEPIGSRTIAKKYNFGISSATIRNEMSDLEELGLIIAPHASAGRVPSDKGYRLYVDNLMSRRDLTDEEINVIKGIITSNINQIDYLMKETARAVAFLTNCAVIVAEPSNKDALRLKHAQLVPLDEHSVVLVMVTDDKKVSNNIIRLKKEISEPDKLQHYTNVLNANLSGLCAADVSEEILQKLLPEFTEHHELLVKATENIASVLTHENNARLYTSGIRNILNFPEFSDVDKAKTLFKMLEEQDVLITLLGGNVGRDIQIVIGEENSLANMRDCSIIKTSYSLSDGKSIGAIGIIGPTRMDYPKVISVLAGIVRGINSILSS